MNPITEMIFYVCAQALNILFLLAVACMGAWVLAWAARKPPTPRLRNSLMRELLEKEGGRRERWFHRDRVSPTTESCIITEDAEL